MKNIVFCFLSFLIVFQANAQKYELGKVTVEELSQKKHLTDSSAVAAIIFKKSRIYYDVPLKTFFEENLFKVKIYKTEGYDYAYSEIRFRANSNSSKNIYSEANTYNLVNNQIVKTKLTKESEFVEERTEKTNVKKITFPDVRVGSIIEYKVKREIGNFELVNYFFEEEIPIDYAELIVEYGNNFHYNKSLTGFLSPTTTSETFSRFHSLYNRDIYKIHNVAAFKNEGFVNNIDNYKSRIRYQLASVTDFFGNRVDIGTDWETGVNKIYSSENFGEELKNATFFEKDIDNALSGITNLNERLIATFNFVKNKVQWNKTRGMFCEKGIKKAYKEGSGNTADINLMLIAMLRYAGIDVNPVLISTRSHGIPIVPSLTAYNHVIAGVKLSNQLVLLDATNKNSLPDVLPIENLNWQARLINKNGSSTLVDLTPKSKSFNAINILAEINKSGTIEGKIRNQHFDYYALIFRDKNTNLPDDQIVEALEKKYSGIEIDKYEVINLKDLSKPIIENYNFSNSNSIEIIADKIYFSPFLFFATTENPFKQENRLYPIDLIFPHQDKFNVTIKIPEGYAVETIPASTSIALPDNLGIFHFSIQENGTQIQLLCTSEFNESLISADYYQALKLYFKQIVDKQTEKIVLKKA